MTQNALVPVRAAVAVAVVGCLAAFTFVGALHAPRPHGLDLALVGESQSTGPVADQLEDRVPGYFDVHVYRTRADAERAIRDRRVAAAYVPAAPQAELLVAGANGAMQVSTLTAMFEQVSQATGSDLVVDDVVPTPDGDRAGLSPFLLTVSLTIPALLLAVLVTALGGPGLSSGARLAAALLGAVTVALVNGAVADLALSALTGHFWAVAGVSTLAVFAMTSAALALQRLLGVAGLALSFALFLVVGMPATGAAVGPAFLPDVLRDLTLVLPSGEALPAMRSVQYFDGAGAAVPLWLLAAWSGAGVLVLLTRPRGRASEEAAGLGREAG